MNDYEILGVSENASPEEVKVAYRAAVKHLHPDVNDAPNAAAMFRLVQDAYSRILDGNPRMEVEQTAGVSKNEYCYVYVKEKTASERLKEEAELLRNLCEKRAAARREEWKKKNIFEKVLFVFSRSIQWLLYYIVKCLVDIVLFLLVIVSFASRIGAGVLGIGTTLLLFSVLPYNTWKDILHDPEAIVFVWGYGLTLFLVILPSFVELLSAWLSRVVDYLEPM